MKTTIKPLGAIFLGAALFTGVCDKIQSAPLLAVKNPAVAAQLQSFIAEKTAQAEAAIKVGGQEAPPVFKTFFAAAQKDDWLAVSNAFEDFRNHVGEDAHSGKTDERLRGTPWEAVKEIWGALYCFNVGGEKYATAFGSGIIGSIPPGSIYFGGTDPGRFVITALVESHADGKPFFVLSQNPLADGTYLKYLRSMYAGKIYTPTDEDFQKSFQDYTTDAQRRLAHDRQFPDEPRQLKPGEQVRLDSNGRIQMSGQMNIAGVRELLTKTIFDKNPDREFFIEESFPLDWMYPHLEPHGLIMKINRQPLPALSDEMVKKDRDYWMKQVSPMIGDWLNHDTTVKEVAAFAEKVYAKNDLRGFQGDPQFIQSADAQKMFSKLRSSLGGLYAWRAQHAADAVEKKRMADEADFAFRQSLALCPYSPEAVFRYVAFLSGENRDADALLIAETVARMPELQGKNGGQLRELIRQLKQQQNKK
jgi:hypothetical protein